MRIARHTREVSQDRQGRGVQHDRFPACLAIRQKQQTTLSIDVLPSKLQDL